MTEIFLDENLSEYVADALNALNKGYFNDIIHYSFNRKSKWDIDNKGFKYS
jgi:hypothetical protein